jgi:SAM-dependent methyltransferase
VRILTYIFQAVKTKGKKLMRDFHCKGDWFELVCESYSNEGCSYSGVILPGFPDDQTQIKTTGQSGCDTLCEAFIFYEDCIEQFKSSVNFVNCDKVIMDFGVGWGRVLRFFMRDFRTENMMGVDINPDLLGICKTTFGFGAFIQSNAMPPVDIEDASIDYIVGYSVFSHLSEEACLAWIKEFGRIIRPGGMVALTTRGRWFLDYCKNLKDDTGYPSALSRMFDNFEEAKSRYDQGEFLHSNADGVTGGGPLDRSFYGETFIPEEYAKKVYSKYFEVQDYEFSSGRSTHPIMFFKK